MFNLENYDFGGALVAKQTFIDTEKYSKQYKNVMVLTQVGSFYEMYGIEITSDNIVGTNISTFSNIAGLEIVDKTGVLVKNKILGEKHQMKMAGFKDHQLDKMLVRLQNDIYTIVVISQKETGVNNPERYVSGIYSPGTSFSENSLTYNTELNNIISCIWVDNSPNKIIIGVSCYNIYTGESNIYEYLTKYENSPLPFVDLEKFISNFRPSETIIISSLAKEQIEKIISYTHIESKIIHNVEITQKVKNCEKQSYQKEILSKFYKWTDFSIFFDKFRDNPIATQAFCYMLDFIAEHNTMLVEKIDEPIFYNAGTKVMLKNYTLRQLDILDDGLRKGKTSSISRFLNDCVTSQGKRHFNTVILNPITDEIELNKEYNIISHIVSTENKQTIISLLKSVCDIQKLIRFVCLKKVNPKNLSLLYNVLKTVKKIKYEIDEIFNSYLTDKNSNVNIDGIDDFIECLENNFFMENCKDVKSYSNFDQDIVKPEISRDLKKKIVDQYESNDKIQAIITYFNDLIGNDFVNLYVTEKLNTGIRCTIKRCELFKNKLTEDSVELEYLSSYDKKKKKFVLPLSDISYEKQSTTNNYIVSSEINKICSTLTNSKQQVSQEINNLYNKLISNLYIYNDVLEQCSKFITLVDFVYCKALLATKYNYCKPVIQKSENSFFSFTALRHPLIEIINNNEFYISNELELNGNGMLIYGCNSSGKSSIIKSVGVNIILAQCGFFVAADSMQYYPYTKIFPRLVNTDNLFEGLSSFIVEMLELKTIVDLCDNNSLVLGNECLSTTDEASATGLIIAILEKVMEKKSTFLFATHMHKLPQYSEIINAKACNKICIKHLTVFYDRVKNKLVYIRKLEDGSGSDCYGNEVCKVMGLDDIFLKRAIELTNKYYPSSESILSQEVSKYNKEKLKTKKCEKCGIKNGEEMHHIIHQEDADENGFVKGKDGNVYHKNHKLNLIYLCNECHKNEHK